MLVQVPFLSYDPLLLHLELLCRHCSACMWVCGTTAGNRLWADHFLCFTPLAASPTL